MQDDPTDFAAPPHATAEGAQAPIHLDFIDSLRGLAFLAVFGLHLTFAVHGLPPLLAGALGRGYAGVQLFFVVSAFTLCASLAQRGRDRAGLVGFFLRRLFRIVPAFWVAILLYWVMRPVGPFWETPPAALPDYLEAITLTHGFDAYAINGVVPGGWSVAVEMQFYLVLPLLFAAARTLRRAVALVVAAIVVSAAAQPVIAHLLAPFYPPASHALVHQLAFYALPTQLPVFCLGILAYRLLGPDRAVLARAESFLPKSARIRAGLALAIVLAVVWPVRLTAWPPALVPGFPGFIGYGVAFVLLIYALATTRVRLLDNRFVRHVGKVSYSAYLVHFFVMVVINTILSTDYEMALWTNFVLQAVLGLSITLGLATVSFAWIETPGIALGRRVIARVAAREPGAQVATGLARASS